MKRKVTYHVTPASAASELKEALPPSQSVAAGPMVRTQIYLSRTEHEFLQAESARRGEPMAAVIRSFIDEQMQLPEEIWDNNPLLAPPADPAFVGPEDGALNHDHYVYGAPKSWVKRKGKWQPAPPLPEDYYTNPASAAAYGKKLEAGK